MPVKAIAFAFAGACHRVVAANVDFTFYATKERRSHGVVTNSIIRSTDPARGVTHAVLPHPFPAGVKSMKKSISAPSLKVVAVLLAALVLSENA